MTRGFITNKLLIRFAAEVLVLLAALFFAAPRASFGATVQARLDHDTIMAGETVGLNIVVEGGNPQSYEQFPAVQGLTIQYAGTSQNVTMINGVTIAKRILKFAITASEPGTYVIPRVHVVVDGKPVATQPVKLTVTKGDASVQNRYAFLRLNVPSK